jgi:hypothetical protein
LLEVYQTFRSDLRSPEAPTESEDLLTDWRLVAFDDNAAVPFLKLTPKHESDLAAVYLYEVNYSNLAGVVRKNHPLDLTRLFVGFDVAVASARQSVEWATVTPTLDVGDQPRLARILQRASGVFAAATMPLLGLPSLVLRSYTRGIVSTFTRFFEDVATFALDKDGERLVLAHLERTLRNIVAGPAFGPKDSLVVAAHSLGSVVLHRHLMNALADPARMSVVPDRIVTYGSPIGLISWLWLFLDFHLAFAPTSVRDDKFFCWNAAFTLSPAKAIDWLNVVNVLDPIATAFPFKAVDFLDKGEQTILGTGTFQHRFIGRPTLSGIAHAHIGYINERRSFLTDLLRVAELKLGGRPVDEFPAMFWASMLLTLDELGRLTGLAAVLVAIAYCALVAMAFGDLRVLWASVVFAYPPAAIGLLAFWQRLFYGGATKRISVERLKRLRLWDLASFPYRVRLGLGGPLGAAREYDAAAPYRPIRAALVGAAVTVVSFVPTAAAMLVPVFLAVLLGNGFADLRIERSGLLTATLAAFVIFTIYLLSCARPSSC